MSNIYGYFSSDINECEDGHCENLCENSEGGFFCGCPEGYTEYLLQCVGM
jgi:hypothetical protein